MPDMSMIMGSIVAVSVPVLMIGIVWYVFWRFNRVFRRATAQRDSMGRAVPETVVASSGVANLSVDVGLIASLGCEAAPQQSLNQLILRPTWGLRMCSLGFSASLGVAMLMSRGTDLALPPLGNAAMFALVGYAVLYIARYELRYDREEIVAPGLAFQRVTVRWADVASLKDNGHYAYILWTHDGRRLEIQKYLVGIADFLTYAREQMEYHKAH